MQSNVSVTIYNGGQQWLHPVQLGTSTLMAISRRRSTIEEILSVLETIDSDNYIDFMKNYYREGLERFGDNWQYTDQLTILNAAASVLRPTNYLEIGVFRGRSMAVVTHNAPECNVFGFDLWLENYSNLQNTGPDFVKSQLQKVGHRGQVTLQSGNSFDTLPLFFKENPDLYFDLVTVDGDHSEEGARIDLENVLPRIRVGGVLVFDDIRHPKHPWLERVWEEVVESNTNFLSAKYTEVGHGVAFAIRRDTDTKIDAVKGAANLRTQQLSSLLEEFRAANSELLEQRTIIEADRELRLAVIQHQGAELGRIPSLEADVAFLKEQLSAAEADRAARLAVIERQGAELGQVQHQIAQALQLLQQATALPRFGVTLPHEVQPFHYFLAKGTRAKNQR
jgi:predicted O-methyltransferase YrrM